METLSASVNTVLESTYVGNTVQDYIITVGIVLLAILLLYILRQQVIYRLENLTLRTSNNFDDLIIKVVRSYGWPLYVFVGLYAGIQFLSIPEFLEEAVRIVVLVVVVYYLVRTLQQIVEFAFFQVIQARLEEEEGFDPSILKFFERVIDVILWTIGVLIVLQNAGFEVGAVLGGLGIGGVALAFALQSVLSDIFASISIFFDRPFQTGDFIETEEDMGTVEQIGIRSTRLESLRGEMLIIANKDLVQSRILNYNKVDSRRISFSFLLPYETPNETLRKIPQWVTEIIEAEEKAEPERATFDSFEDWGLKFTVVYHVKSEDYTVYMETQQNINLSIKEKVEKHGAQFAFPTYRTYTSEEEAPQDDSTAAEADSSSNTENA